MSKVLVTGGAGFIGSTLVDKLIDQGHQVVVIDDLSTGKLDYINSKAEFKEINICDKDELEKIFQEESFDLVFHLAAQIDVRISVDDPARDITTNVIGGVNLLQLCDKYKVKKIIFVSTGGVMYGDAEQIPTPETYPTNPICPYGINKLTFEKYLHYYYKVYGQDYTVLRFANVYGPRQYKGGEAGVISIFIDNAVNGQQLKINGDGLQTRDFIYVDDAIQALLAAAQTDFQGALNISSSQEVDLLQIIKEIRNSYDAEIDVVHMPAKLGEQRRSCLDNKLAMKVLGWQPQVEFSEGVSRTLEWSREQAKK